MENEKRLIDADALMAEITEENPMVHFGPFGYCGCSPNSDFGEKVFMRERVLEIVESAPTVDAVEVVRCKDCKHWSFICDNAGDCRNPRFAIPGTVDPTMYAHEYCALGEREA